MCIIGARGRGWRAAGPGVPDPICDFSHPRVLVVIDNIGIADRCHAAGRPGTATNERPSGADARTASRPQSAPPRASVLAA